MKSAKFGIGLLVGCAALTAGGSVFAQEAAVGTQTQTTATTTTTTTTPVAEPAPATTPAPTQTGMALPGADAAADATDHNYVVGTFGIGYMGRRTIAVAPNGAGDFITQDAPVIGLRYWLSPQLGIDAGLGFAINNGSTKTGDTSVDNAGYTAFILHGGVPLALAGGKHISFQVIPELNVGFASAKTGGPASADTSGIHFDIGARAGGEVQFGFIGIPELSLQAGIGLALSYDRAKVSGTPDQSVSRFRFGTMTGDNPWNIFTGNIAALYYFK